MSRKGLWKFFALLKHRDLGYIFAAAIGALIGGALPGGAFVICPTAKTGSDADYASAIFAALTFVATVLIAVVAHQLNSTLKTSQDRKSIVAARVFCKVAGTQIKHSGATCSSVGKAVRRFIDGVDSFETLRKGMEYVDFGKLHEYLYENEAIGHLPDATAQLVGKFCADYAGAYDAIGFLIVRAPNGMPSKFASFDGRIQLAFNKLAAELQDCAKEATNACVALEHYLATTSYVEGDHGLA